MIKIIYKKLNSYFVTLLVFILLLSLTDKTFTQVRSLKLGVGPSFTLNNLLPDNARQKITLGGGFDILYGAFPNLGIGINNGYYELGGIRNDTAFRTSVWQFKTSLILNMMPYSDINPFIYSGIGLIYFDPKFENGKPLPNLVEGRYQKWSVILPVGLGVNVFLAEDFCINFSADYNFAMSDYLDDLKVGSGDQFVSFKIGISYFFFDKFYILRERRSKQ